MQFKDSILLLTALSLGAVARPHGHERRHAHPQPNAVVEEAPAVTDPAQVADKVVERAVGDEVFATINGVLVSWINEWAGGVDSTTSTTSTSTSSSSTTSIYVPPTTTTAEPTTSTSAPAVESSVSATPVSSGSGGDWTSYPSDGDFSTSGFGATNYIAEALGIEWSGNTGLPWGSNIQQVSESDASQYRNVIRFEGSNTDDWTVIFWNKMGPNKQMTGFFSPNKALSFTLAPNEVAYVAIDDESTGGWTAYQGDDCPLSDYGSYAATWGEFTMRKAPNFSSWDVSCIQAQNANKDIQGMSICTHDGSQCSSITKNMGKVTNAYTSAETDINGIGGNLRDEAVRLVVNLDYA